MLTLVDPLSPMSGVIEVEMSLTKEHEMVMLERPEEGIEGPGMDLRRHQLGVRVAGPSCPRRVS